MNNNEQWMAFYNIKEKWGKDNCIYNLWGKNEIVTKCDLPLLLYNMSFFKAYKTAKEEGYYLISYSRWNITERIYPVYSFSSILKGKLCLLHKV